MTAIPIAISDRADSERLRDVRVLAILDSLELFGHERGNIAVFRTLRDADAAVFVGVNARENGGAVREELERAGFETFSLPFNPQWSVQFVRRHPTLLFSNPAAVIRCSWELLRCIRAFKPTHIHLGSPTAYSFVSAALGICRVPLIYRMGDCPPRKSPFNMAIWRLAVRRATKIVAVSHFVRASATDAGVPGQKIETIYNIAPTALLGDSRLSADTNVPRAGMLYVGAVAEHKGLVQLIEAIALLKPTHPGLRLDIVGGSRWDLQFRERLVALTERCGLSAQVIFHGYVADPSPFYRRATFHVAPSVWEEPTGNVVIEAKREGTPSVVFPSGGLKEMVNHRVDGYICRDRSAAALTEGIRWMIDHPHLERIAAAAREDYCSRFGQERFASRWASVYNTSKRDSEISA
jgi:glycosyltransferase involved in cell wall biosynthesis